MTFAKLVPKTSKTDCIRLSYSHQAPTWSPTVTHSPCASPGKRMPSGHRGQLAAACPGPRKMVPFWTFFEAFWSTLKQFEIVWTVGAGTVWSSLKLTGAKHSITWHNFEASRRRDSTSACLVSTSSTCPIVTARITLWNSYVAKNRICKCQKKHAYNILQQPTFEILRTTELQ